MIKIGTVYGDVIEKGGIKNVTITHNYYTPVEPKHENPTTVPDVTVAEGDFPIRMEGKDPLAKFILSPNEEESISSWLRQKVKEGSSYKEQLLPLRAMIENGRMRRLSHKEFIALFFELPSSTFSYWMGQTCHYSTKEIDDMIATLPSV